MNILIAFLTAVHVLVALFLIVLVLMQKSKDQGVGAAFGGGMTETVFGAGTTTALVRMTIYCAVGLLVTTLTLAMLHAHRRGGTGSLMRQNLGTSPAGQTAPAVIPGMPETEPGDVPAEMPAPAQETAPAATAAPAETAPPAAESPPTPAPAPNP